MAEDVGFEPTEPFGPSVFKTAALNHSANLPFLERVTRIELVLLRAWKARRIPYAHPQIWSQESDSNRRPQSYEPCELASALSC